ncbi:helix-turn-helix domain-containing protein [Sphaerisporangium aureirubrum]|uniref:Helix-turn-helix domain-containing protein n=1 Tax=Sphaerisporangium aureirubrum TaxID=1544736 RepID=A0ABW1NUQ4_9ACTN
MDTAGDLGDFLRGRRARLRPEDVGLTSHGARRVAGLRREELAQLAGISTSYYTRLEQGHGRNTSPEIVDALARALRLDDDETAHLRDLALPRRRGRTPAMSRSRPARPGVRQLIAAAEGVAAVAMDRRGDVLDWNPPAHALLAGHCDLGSPHAAAGRPNLYRMLFLDRHTRDLHVHWGEEARRVVASLRLVAGRHPEDRPLAELIGELLMKSSEFADLWARHPVLNCVYGTKHFHHPVVGRIELSFEAVHLADDCGARILFYSAEPGTASEAALRLLSTVTDGSAHHPASAVGRPPEARAAG